jgi:hypothetical protein
MNRLYQPYAGAGSYGFFPELNEIYEKYKVVSSSLSVMFHPLHASHYDVAIAPKPTDNAVPNVEGLAETRYARMGSVHEGGNNDYLVLTSFVRTNQIEENAGKDELFTCLNTGSPTDPIYWHVTAKPIVDATANLQMNFKLCAEVVFSQISDSTGSS